MIAAASTGMAVVVGSSVVGFLTFMGAVSNNGSKSGADFWLRSLLDTLINLTVGKLAKILKNKFDLQAFGSWMEGLLEWALTTFLSALNGATDYLKQLYLKNDSTVNVSLI